MAGEITKTLARCVAARAQAERERDEALARVKGLEFALEVEKRTRAELEARLTPVRLVDGKTGKPLGD